MTEQHVKALFLLAGIEIGGLWETANNYWPDSPAYSEVRRDNPWWLVKTPHGLIHLGWRKRVISLDWTDTPLRQVITQDDVTKDETLVHAWTYAKAVEYLTSWKRAANVLQSEGGEA